MSLCDEKKLYTILGTLNIVYVEDDKDIRENIKKTLTLFSKKIATFEDANDAFEYINNHQVDIIISDITLPSISGIEFAKKIKNLNEKIPIIFLSAHLESKYLLEAIKISVIDYLPKPVGFEELKEALLKACSFYLKNNNLCFELNNGLFYNLEEKNLFNKEKNIYITLTNKENLLLEYLVNNNKRVISNNEIKNNIWEDSIEATDSAFKNLFTKLRKKIGKESIKNISKVGYQIVLKQ